ncbi:hypothetical protein [Allobaculum sp. Allo2]|uniref:hypothetical protein n=1 Tax=Allobaculum sp. Allo2 TaxID=2853432 RepID=UPI003461D697
MKLKCAWMYHDIMDLYGDKGNIMTLQSRAKSRGIDLEVTTVGIGQKRIYPRLIWSSWAAAQTGSRWR